MKKSIRITDEQKHDLCLSFAKERLSRNEANLTYDETETENSYSFYCFIRDYAEARSLIDDHIDQLPN